MKLVRKALLEGSFLLDLDAGNMTEICRSVMDLLVARGSIPPGVREKVERAIIEREDQFSTAIGHAVAVPHVFLDDLAEQQIVFVRLVHPINMGAPDGVPVRFLFVLLGPTGAAAAHLDTLTAIARLMTDEDVRYQLLQARSQLDIVAAVDEFVRRNTIPIPKRHEIPEGLRYTGRICGGIIADVRRRWPDYASDFRDGMSTKCLASILFLVFACLAPAITFGGIFAEQTGFQIGVVELLIATTICGTVYALISGQPLIILGGTGPLLIFTVMLYELCKDPRLGIGEENFLSVYAWVGFWTMVFVVALAAFDASCLIRFFTRFTDETFAALISIIFIYEAVRALVEIFVDVYSVNSDEEVSHDRALVPLLLTMGTYFIATNLSRFHSSKYLVPRVREFLADFGPSIALFMMTLAFLGLNYLEELGLKELAAPDRVQPTLTDEEGEPRNWLVNPFAAPVWTWFAAIVPAALGTVLVYLDQNITARLVNSPDHNLQKGEAYHLDLAVVGVLVGICSLFGLPWLVAATVRSLNHVRSLATTEDIVSDDGDKRQQIIHVRENRVTALAIHLLIGLALFALPLLRVIPMAVLYGLFLFMGVVSMKGNQFFERLALWPMDSSLYPRTHYLRKVPLMTIHKFTAIQLLCLIVLWVVKSTKLGILFPLFIAFLVPIRVLMSRWFQKDHLEALDQEEEPEEEAMQWV